MAPSRRVLVRVWALSLAVVVSLVAFPRLASASSPVIPPQAKPYGLTYGQWSAKWWQWSMSLPVAGHPLSGTEPGDCLEGQVRPVYFVGGVINGSATQTRTCTIPPGTAIYFPVANSECSSIESPPFFGATPAARKECAEDFIDTYVDTASLSATLDGTSLGSGYRVTSPDFAFTTPVPNVLGVDSTSNPEACNATSCAGFATDNGYYLMLAPLSVGKHRLHFTATFPDFGITFDITYWLTVSP